MISLCYYYATTYTRCQEEEIPIFFIALHVLSCMFGGYQIYHDMSLWLHVLLYTVGLDYTELDGGRLQSAD